MLYNQFVSITELDNSTLKSIFNHIESKINIINNIKLEHVAFSIKDDNASSIVYELKPGNLIPLTIFKCLKILFTNFKLLDDDIVINLTTSFENKEIPIMYINNTLNVPAFLTPLFSSDCNFFNYLDGVSYYSKFNELFDNLFSFVFKKEFPELVDSVFEKQLKKYESSTKELSSADSINNSNNQILIEKLIKQKNEIHEHVNKLNKDKMYYVESYQKIQQAVSSRENNLSKYDSLKIDYETLQGQQKSYFKTVIDTETLINKITAHLQQLSKMLDNSILPESEKTTLLDEQNFYVEKKYNLQLNLKEAEVNLENINSLIQTTREQMDTIYTELTLIQDEKIETEEEYKLFVNNLTTEIEQNFFKLNEIDLQIDKLEKNITDYDIARDYKELKNSNTVDIEILKNALNTPLIPNSVNIVYKYLYKLTQYHALSIQLQNKLKKELLEALFINPTCFFELYEKDKTLVIIK